MTTLSKRTSYLLVFVLLCCCGTAQAQDQLKLRMSLSYQGATATQVFEALASVLGCRLQLDRRVTGSVTLDVRNVTAETVLRAVCESVGCRWRIEKGQLVVDYDPEGSAKAQADLYAQVRLSDVHQEIPAQILWSDAPLDAAAKTLARMLDAELSLDPSLSSRRISLNQNRDTAWAALSAVCQQAGCRWRMVNDPKRLLLVIPVSTAPFESDFPLGVAHVGEPGVTAPKVVNRAVPRYAEAAKQAKIEGVVVVDCVVRPDGTVGQVRVVRSLDKVHGLDGEAVMAAKLHVFEPGTKDGKPIPVVARLTFTFTLR
jgi:TonB family protein